MSLQTLQPELADEPGNRHGHARADIAPFLPEHSRRVLEIGCGDGSTLAWLKARRRCDYAVGVEASAESAAIARRYVDQVETGDVERAVERLGALDPFDLVLCLDVLEHLVDPWRLLRRLDGMTTENAVLIVSVPNVRHYKVSLPLLLYGQWQYQPAGVLAQTHLRFFTRSSAAALAASANLKLLACVGSRPPVGSTGWLADFLSMGLLRDLFAVQYVVAASRRSA